MSRAGALFWLGARVLGGGSGVIVVTMCLAGNMLVAQSQTEALRSNHNTLFVAAGFFLAFHLLAGMWLRAVVVPRSLAKILAGWFAFQMLVLFTWIGIYWISAHEPPWGSPPGEMLPAVRTLAILIAAAAIGSAPAAAGFAIAQAARRSAGRSSRRRIRDRRRTQRRPSP